MPIASAKGDASKSSRHEQGLTKISLLRLFPLNGGSGNQKLKSHLYGFPEFNLLSPGLSAVWGWT